ncbi:hypothetical protein NL676_017840 [Syzygium grande]|nr:hypothetical protein NL676_017840 [Syzygium grande]
MTSTQVSDEEANLFAMQLVSTPVLPSISAGSCLLDYFSFCSELALAAFFVVCSSCYSFFLLLFLNSLSSFQIILNP